MLIKAQCKHCQNEFESDGENRTEFCPHCGKETTVIATKQKSHNQPVPDGKIEITLDIIGMIFLLAGFLSAAICAFFLIIGIAGPNPSNEADNIYLITAIIVSISQGIIIRVLLDALAEIIRLLRKIAAKN